MHVPALNAYDRELEQCLEESDEDLGLMILEILQEQDKENRSSQPQQPLGIGFITEPALSSPARAGRPFDHTFIPKFRAKVQDAWRWLIDSKLIRPESDGYPVTLTELGLQTGRDQRALFDVMRALPETLVHPHILTRIRSDFRAGRYDKAVHDAFKQLEAETMEAARLEESVSGEDVFKRAFRKGTSLYESTERPNDVRDLFCVAYRLYRHKPAHGNPKIEPLAAARMLVMASHLLHKLDDIRATCRGLILFRSSRSRQCPERHLCRVVPGVKSQRGNMGLCGVGATREIEFR